MSKLFPHINKNLYGYLRPIYRNKDINIHSTKYKHKLSSDTGIKDLSQNNPSVGPARPFNPRHAKFMGFRTNNSTMNI